MSSYKHRRKSSRQLVEQTLIKRGDPRYDAIDRAAFASKNLYNTALYEVRESFIFQHRYMGYPAVYHRMKTHAAYRAWPRKVSQQVLRLLDKVQGRNILVYTIPAISKPARRRGSIQPAGLPIEIPTKQAMVDQVRIVPRTGCYVVEVIDEQAIQPALVDASLYAAIDI